MVTATSPAEPSAAGCPCKGCAEVRARLAGLLQRDTPAEVEARVRLVVHGGPVPPELQGARAEGLRRDTGYQEMRTVFARMAPPAKVACSGPTSKLKPPASPRNHPG